LHGGRDLRDELGANRSGARAVQVDEMDSGRALGDPALRELDRIAGSLDYAVVLSAVEADRAGAEDIYGRYDFYRTIKPLL
jgi:hypothetical protein